MPSSSRGRGRLHPLDPTSDETRRRRELCTEGAVSVAKAAEFIGASRTFVYGEMDAGRLPFIRVGRKRALPRRALVRWLAERMESTKP